LHIWGKSHLVCIYLLRILVALETCSVIHMSGLGIRVMLAYRTSQEVVPLLLSFARGCRSAVISPLNVS
jgi:hypothetical protein